MKVTSAPYPLPDNRKVSVSWPDDAQRVTLFAYADPPGTEPADLSDLIAWLIGFGFDIGPSGGSDDGDMVDFAAVTYPDRVRVYVDGRRISLERAHAAFEAGLSASIRNAIAHLDERAD